MPIKDKVSVLIPSRNEKFLQQTVQGILKSATGDIEIIVVLDGYWPPIEEIVEDPRVTYIHRSVAQGMRSAINTAAEVATGEYLLKSDAHCLYDEGFDEKLKEDIVIYQNKLGLPYLNSNDIKDYDNWIVIPRRHRLDAEKWQIQEQVDDRPPIDYEYLSSPGHYGAKGNKWNARTIERMDKLEYLIDETPTFQGSCWFMTRNHYLNRLGGMSEVGYGSFVRESQEIGLKTWLSGGKVFVNKKTWYAHLHKGPKYGRMYYIDARKMEAGNKYCDDFWFNNRWTEAKYDLAWFIERFMPMPNWTQEAIEQVRKK